MGKKTKKLLQDALIDKLTKANESLKKNRKHKERIIKEVVAPYAKNKLQEMTRARVVNVPFTDPNASNSDYPDEEPNFRYYWRQGGRNQNMQRKKSQLGKGRTQKTSYKRMADERYISETYLLSKDDKNPFVRLSNEFPVGKSIFNTPIKNQNDKNLFTRWIVNGSIVMPSLKIMEPDEWKVYCLDPANRYKARPFVDETAVKLRNDKEFARIVSGAAQEELLRIINKK